MKINTMQIGEKVVCVDDDWRKSWADPRPWFSELPVAGRVYVVSEITTARNGEPMLLLVGIFNTAGLAGFYPHRFRLLAEMKAATQRFNSKTNQPQEKHHD